MTVPTRLIGGRYRILRKIAEGGMGEVFQAEHNLSKKAVALKVLFPHIGKDEAARQRFLREVSAPAQIGHEGIVEVYDAGFDTEDGSLFVAMELLDGEPLRDRLARGGVPITQLLDWYEQILDPLAAAHAKGIVHRDLKPENIMFTTRRDGVEVLKILDFGIARDLDSSQSNVTHTGIAMGTPHYMAPEQAMSAKGVSAAADVWALGVMLYEALLGRPPFDGETASAIVVHACTQPHSSLAALAPHVPAPLARFVDRCLAKEPQGRPGDAGQMLAELRQVRQEMGGAPTGQPVAPPGMPGGSATGPMTGQPAALMAAHGGPPTSGVAGTAVLPAMQAGGFGTPPPGYTTGAPGSYPGGSYPGGPVPTPQSHPGAQPSYGTPPPGPGFGQPGFGTQPAGQFGTPAPGGGFGAPAPSGFGAPVPPPKKSSLALPIIAGVLVLGLVLVGGGIVAAIALFPDDEPTQPVGTIGTLRISSDVTAGELYVDGSSRGPYVAGQVARLMRGHHTVEIREGGVTVASAQVDITANQETAVTMNRTAQPPPPQNVGGSMIPGPVTTRTGQLRPGDTTLQNTGEYYDTYTFNWTAGTLVRLELDSPDFDTYLILKAPSGVQQDNDDREPGNLNAAIEMTLNETGTWQVLCTSFASGQTGDYTLTIRGAQ